MPKKDYTHDWKDWKKTDCSCRIRIYAGSGAMAGKIVVIATDTNHGNSVTNEAEAIATDVCAEQSIHRLDLVFIEHYEKQTRFEETFDLVEFNWSRRLGRFESPTWTHLTRETVESYTGGTFDD